MKNKKSVFITIFVIVAVLLLAGVGTYALQQKVQLSERDAEASQTLAATDETPYTDLSGNPFSFDAYRGKVRVVNSWASWCPFCTEELKNFETLAQEYAEQDVVVIAVNRKESKERAQAFLDTLGDFTYTKFAIDLTDAFYKSIGGFSMPETVFYDAQGNIVLHIRGLIDIEDMRQYTEKAIASDEK